MTFPVWRWDQGRLNYFNFDNLRRMASVLAELNGVEINLPGLDPLREALQAQTGLPFLPFHYKVWRNYARIFKWTLLAAQIDNRLMVTDVCHKLAGPLSVAWDVDEYLSFIIPRIYNPSPAAQEYNTSTPQVFPLCVILKYLLALYQRQGEATVDLPTIFSHLVGNRCTGSEPIEYYATLPATNYRPQGDQERQLRELLIFISQSSFLKWHDGKLRLDLDPGDSELAEQLRQIVSPIIKPRQPDLNVELIQLGAIDLDKVTPIASVTREVQNDLVFTEGKRVRVTHLRVERSPQLRKLYFASLAPPFLCDMCQCDTKERYPWTDNLLELHHLLPLSSVVKINVTGTSFDDLTPLCPNCHRSVHAYYRLWLRDQNMDDFADVRQACLVYGEAKSQIYLG